jgi:1D-myo-inositol-tetrakisphosphate 5-kinase/inositol-polyphosphate multikinase
MSSESFPIPSPAPLTSQVGGHPGVLVSEDEALVIKPALPLELEFYQTHISDVAFEPLRPFLPIFYGTLKLEGKVDESVHDTLVVKPLDDVQGAHKESLVLENLSHSFVKPNILDIKLGTVLYDESASSEKRARMEKTARQTTSGETGIRITGFQVHDNNTHLPVITPKAYGKSIKVSDLPDAMGRVFPVAPSTPTVSDPTQSSTPSFGLPRQVLFPILEWLREDVAELQEAFHGIHLRMVGGSLLVVYEADWERAAEGVKALQEDETEEDEDEDEEDEEDTDEAGHKTPSPPFIVKLIDFAHTRMKPGEGPDQGVLLGLGTILKLLDGRIEQLRNAETS